MYLRPTWEPLEVWGVWSKGERVCKDCARFLWSWWEAGVKRKCRLSSVSVTLLLNSGWVVWKTQVPSILSMHSLA